MSFVKAGLYLVVLMCMLTSPVFAVKKTENPESRGDEAKTSLHTRDTLTGNWFGFGDVLEDNGISVAMGVTQGYQYNLHDGTQPGTGDYSGSYDLEIEADMGRLAGLDNGTMFLLAEGSWGSGKGLDARSVGSLFGINDDFGGTRNLDLTELWYQHNFSEDRIRVRLGKLDLTGGFEFRGYPGAFDGNMYANDETSQFLNASLVNNPAIPFPDNGLGIMVFAQPTDGWYLAFGSVDAEADARETGINTTFDGDTHFFHIAETGVVPMLYSPRGRLPGSYRLGIWNARLPQEYLDGSRSKRDVVGTYISVDQMVWRENDVDLQGLGLLTRLGWADDKTSEIKFFGSAGIRYQGIIPDRPDDILGVGFAYGRLSNYADFSASSERVVEMYYNAEITPWLHISPDIQWISDPGGVRDGGDAIVAGLRLQMDF